MAIFACLTLTFDIGTQIGINAVKTYLIHKQTDTTENITNSHTRMVIQMFNG